MPTNISHHISLPQVLSHHISLPQVLSRDHPRSRTTQNTYCLTPTVKVAASPVGQDKSAVALSRHVGHSYKLFLPH